MTNLIYSKTIRSLKASAQNFIVRLHERKAEQKLKTEKSAMISQREKNIEMIEGRIYQN
jgi:hypothetical protein